MLDTSLVRLDDVPVEERFDFWWEAVAKSVVSVDAVSEQASDFWAEMLMVDLGVARLSRVRCAPFEARRTTRMIRRSDPGLYQLSLTVRGRSGIRQLRRETALGPGDLMLYDTSRPFHAMSWPPHRGAAEDERNVSDGLILQFPHSALGLPRSAVERLLAVRIPGRDGVGALLRTMLWQLVSRFRNPTPADTVRVSGIVLDLVTAVLAHELEAESAPALRDADQVLVLRMQAFIEERLDDPALTPAVVAAAHHVSLRHLHKLFASQALTVAGWIRRRRLERCRRDLSDPLLDAMPIRAVAARWGFPSDSHFNRVFSATFGEPPAAFRRRSRAPEAR
ncbi:helix-turn-helix domain-containing protein [Sphaerisporangium rubeum]|uniref:AraC-like DNA-binding protein n=1 Tax=Sphaerisporangium rubeum TaxID=321317 RepID=A0A7X0IDQ6_9ACTN|nr:helix-turn-helix domain-containing protein [Sphaerisporangium rubeum]MBB6473366.1 AraC-like DNA-binding protein [Sphaerisporangium rubeum]